MQTIKRDIYVTKNVLQAPIEVTEGTNSIAIEFDVRDYEIPASAAAVAYSLSTSSMEEPNKALADVSGNKITIIPSEAFFLPGQNVMQIRIIDGNSKLISFNIIVKCTGKMRFGDEKEAQQSTLVEQMLAKLGEYQKKSASPYNFKGSCLSSELPASGNTINDTYYCTDLKYRKTWNGSAWEQSSLNEADYEDELTKTNGEVSSLKEDLEHQYDIITRGVTSYAKKIVFPFIRGNLNLLTGEVTEYDNPKKIVSKDYVVFKTYEQICLNEGYLLKWVSYEKKNDIYTYHDWGIINGGTKTYFTDDLPRKFSLERTDNGVITDTEYYNAYVLVHLYADKSKLDCLEYNTNMVCFGDSRMQGVGNSANKCTNIMSKILNCNILNSGFGGTTFSKSKDTDGCFVNIVDAIVSNNWNNMDTFMNNFCTTYPQFKYVREFYNKLKTTNFSKVNSVIIAYGTNDWRMGRTLDNSNNNKDTTTILGAFRYCVDKLLTTYPNLRLYVFTPAYRDKLGENKDETCYTFKTNGLLLNDVNKALQEVSNSYGIPTLNMLENGNVNPYNSTNWLNDGTHCTYEGYDLLGTQYAKFILNH